jgi:hypothetical protein
VIGAIELRQGQVLIGPLFSEPMRVETVTANGAGSWSLGLVGQSSEQFRRVTLTAEQLAVRTVRGLKALRMRKRASLKGSVMSINTASDSRLREATTPWFLAEFRQRYPEYNGLGDAELADAVYKQFYADMPCEQFERRLAEKIAASKTKIVQFQGQLHEFPVDFTEEDIATALRSTMKNPWASVGRVAGIAFGIPVVVLAA